MGLWVVHVVCEVPEELVFAELKGEIDRVIGNSGAVLGMSSSDDGFSSSQPSMCWPNDAQDFLGGSLEEDFFCRIRSLDDG